MLGLDPIDVTTNFVYGYNISLISLELYDNSFVVFGVVYSPFSDKSFTAVTGNGAFLNGKPIHVSKREMQKSIIEFVAGSTREEDADKSFEIGEAIYKQCVDIRRICSYTLGLRLIAAGRIDGCFESYLKPWDYAVGSLILNEAGGVGSDYDGTKPPFDVPSSIIYSNGVIHSRL